MNNGARGSLHRACGNYLGSTLLLWMVATKDLTGSFLIKFYF